MNVKHRVPVVAALIAACVVVGAQRAHAQQFELLHSFAGCPAEGCGTTGDAAHPQAEVVLGQSLPRTFIAGPDGNIYGTSAAAVFRITPGGQVEVIHRFPGHGTGGCGTGGIGFSASGVLYVMGRGCPTTSTPAAILRLANGVAEIVQEFPGSAISASWLAASTTGAFYISTGLGPPFSPIQYQRWNDADGTLTPVPWTGRGPMRALANGHVYVRETSCVSDPFSGAQVCFSDRLVPLDGAAQINLPLADDNTLADENFIVGPDGHLYGSVHQQGARRIYRLSADGTYTLLPGSEGLWPLGFSADGSIYGRTGAEGAGALARLTRASQLPVHAFNGLDGAGAFSPLVLGTDGHLYGVRSDGGEHGLGVAYRIRTARVDLRANGADGPVTVGAGESLTIAMAFDAPGTEIVDPSEVYFAVVTPASQILWATPSGFSLTPAPLYSGSLPSFASTPLITIPDAAVLPAGDYYWVAIVDADANGVPNGHNVDFVQTTKIATAAALPRKR